jgi:hypothetical protein
MEEDGVPIFEPDAFKIEMIGQLVRRLTKEEATALAEEIFSNINFIEASELFDMAYSVAVLTGSRAIDSFYVAAAKLEEAFLVSNDKHQVESARRSGVEVYYLLDEFEEVRERIAK